MWSIIWSKNRKTFGSSIPLSAALFVVQLSLASLIDCHSSGETSSRQSTKIYRHATSSSGSNSNNNIRPAGGEQIYLESLDDLEHVAYLAMRNFNITDESLIESSWNSGSNILGSKQYQKVVAASSSATSVTGADTAKDRLALMLESFILHLRNGHLRQLKLDELKEIVSLGAFQQQQQTNENITSHLAEHVHFVDDNLATEVHHKEPQTDASSTLSPIAGRDDMMSGNYHHIDDSQSESQARCNCLVSLYVQELKERHRLALSSSQQQQQQQQQQEAAAASLQANGSDNIATIPFDQSRLLKLCRLVVQCHSADDLVGLLGGPWRDAGGTGAAQNNDDQQLSESNGADDDNGADNLAREPTYQNYPTNSMDTFLSQRLLSSSTDGNGNGNGNGNSRPRSLRDSLSQSLGKLCPLLLFQLHDEDGMCIFRRDDRPPMVTVWAFATLFVTIVSFVSLIGLSITPLLGPSANRTNESSSLSSSSSSSNSELSHAGMMQQVRAGRENHRHRHRQRQQSFQQHQQQQQQQQPNRHQHRACLTLFEGLAVGSLVGSALFSLIPQAFELQERESNQGFLLKALIIFFGLYLFFCSERIMRIILDTRQYRKRKRHGTNLLAPPSTTMDNLAGFATTPTSIPPGGCGPAQSASQATNKHHTQHPKELRSSSSAKDHQSMQPHPARVFGDKKSSSSSARLRCQPNQSVVLTSSASEQIAAGRQQQQLLKSVNFPAARLEQQQQQQQQSRESTRTGQSRRSQRRERIHGSGVTGPDSVAAASKSRKERRQATKRHQSRTRRSTTAAAGRRQKRKTRYQLLVQSKRLHNDSLTLPRDGGAGELCDTQGSILREERLPLRKRNSLSSSDGAASYSLDSSVHESGSLAEESYDSTTSLDSSSSNSDSDDTDYRLAMGQRSRQQQHQQQHQHQLGLINAGQLRAPQLSSIARRPANFNLHSSDQGSFEPSSNHPHSQGQPQNMIAQNKRPSYSQQHNHPSEKQEISTVAWMIVLGDGLHNFIDGISIGAAFSESILSGVSISVAVICEEFPHELGDFAVLVSSGMTVRQALGYNFLSACTCYLGMAIGIILGDVNDGASYISALAAGVFLYIALVDMMGELSASLEESSRDSIGKTLKLLLLQNVGIFIGISIILVLSFIDF